VGLPALTKALTGSGHMTHAEMVHLYALSQQARERSRRACERARELLDRIAGETRAVVDGAADHERRERARDAGNARQSSRFREERGRWRLVKPRGVVSS